LVDGLALTGLDRALIVADSVNGLSLSMPLGQWLSIPPTMTATLLRPPAGEWVHLACRTRADRRERPGVVQRGQVKDGLQVVEHDVVNQRSR
jgi:hypothetical protein